MSALRRSAAIFLFSATLLLVTFGPAHAQEAPWRYDYNAARKDAKERNKPIVIDVGMDHCKYCDELDATTFRDPAVVKVLTEHFILIKVNASRDPALAQALGIKDFPTLVYAAPSGKIVAQQGGVVAVAPFRQQLDKLLALAGDPVQRPSTPTGSASRARVPAGTKSGEGDEPARLALTCAKLTDALGCAYLELAESLLRSGQTRQAQTYLEKAVQTCPGTEAAQQAQERLQQLLATAGAATEGRPVIRSQAP